VDVPISVCLISCNKLLACVSSVKYLGTYVSAGRTFQCSYDHLKVKFYRAFNALYCRGHSTVYPVPRSGPNKTVLLLYKLLTKVLPVTTFHVCNSAISFYFNVCMLFILRLYRLSVFHISIVFYVVFLYCVSL